MNHFEEDLHKELNQFPNQTKLSMELENKILVSLHKDSTAPIHQQIPRRRSRPSFLYAIAFVVAAMLVFLVSFKALNYFKASPHSLNRTSGPAQVSTSSNIKVSSSASWAYAFVRVNGESYGVSSKDPEVERAEVGDKIGVVKRLLKDSGSGPLTEKDFDSNTFPKGTPLYKDAQGKDAIIYKKEGKFFLANPIHK